MPTTPMSSFDRFLRDVIRYGLLAVFALPFIVLLHELYPWVTGKILGFEIIVELLFPLYILLALRRKEYRPGKNPFLYALLAYFAVATLSMLLGDNLHRSFWDKPDRLTGMFFQYHLMAFFLMAGAVWQEVMEVPIIASIISAVILSLHAMSQAAFPQAGSDGRGSATLGNADYLGQYLVPQLFLCGWLIRRHWKSGLRWLWIASAIAIAFGVFSAKSKGALVGVFIGVLVIVLIAAFRGSGRLKMYGRLGILALALAIAGFFVGEKIPPVHRWLYANRMSLQYIQETSGSRKLLIANAVKGISQRPLLGWGPENFEDGFYFNYDPLTLRFSDYETRQDRPHNLVLEILHNLGVFGFLAYLAVFVCATRLALPKKRSNAALGTLLLAAAFAQVATDLFIFETPMSYQVLFFVFALIAADAGTRRESMPSGNDESSAAAVPLALLAAAVSIWCLWYAVIGTSKAATVTAGMIMGLSQNMTADEWSKMLVELRAAKSPYYERDIRALASHLSTVRGEYLDGPFKPVLIDLMQDEYQRMRNNRTDFVHALVVSSSYLSIANRTPEQQTQLEDAVETMRQDGPNRHEVEVIQAQVAWEKGDLAAAEQHIRRIHDLDPGNPLGDGWWIRWLLEFKNPAEAPVYLAAHPEVAGDHEAWSMVEYGTLHLLGAKRWKDLLALQRASVEQHMQNVQWDLTGAIGAWGLGDKASSDAIIAAAREKYPDRLDLINQIEASRDEIVKNGG